MQPRDLRIGIYRGGDAPQDLYVKLKNGIAGTTMTSVAAQLSDDNIWHVVAFARSLPSDPLSTRTAPRRQPEKTLAKKSDNYMTLH